MRDPPDPDNCEMIELSIHYSLVLRTRITLGSIGISRIDNKVADDGNDCKTRSTAEKKPD